MKLSKLGSTIHINPYLVLAHTVETVFLRFFVQLTDHIKSQKTKKQKFGIIIIIIIINTTKKKNHVTIFTAFPIIISFSPFCFLSSWPWVKSEVRSILCVGKQQHQHYPYWLILRSLYTLFLYITIPLFWKALIVITVVCAWMWFSCLKYIYTKWYMMRILYLGLILIHTLNFTEHLLSIIYRAFTEHLLSFAISNLSYCITIKIIISSAYFFLFFIFFTLVKSY